MSGDDRGWALMLAAVSVFLVLVMIVSYIWFPFAMWTEERDAGEEIVRDQMDAEKAIENYRWFRTQYGEIKAQRNQIENAYEAEEQFHETYGDDPDEWSRQAETRHGRLHERITGYQNQLDNLVSEYNARSSDATRSVFKCALPYQVDERFAISGPPGSGDAETPSDGNVEVPPPEECDGLPKNAQATSNE